MTDPRKILSLLERGYSNYRIAEITGCYIYAVQRLREQENTRWWKDQEAKTRRKQKHVAPNPD